MPNQLNYSTPLETTIAQRPERVRPKDAGLLAQGRQQILFGTSTRDIVEVWVYNLDGSKAGHVNLGAVDPALSLTTLIDNTGPVEMLNIDLKTVLNRAELIPGRYVMVANFFRNEVGSEDTYKLYISEISDDRTELRLTLVNDTAEALKDIYEFVTPSVPKRYANGLIDEVFGKSLDFQNGEAIQSTAVEALLDGIDPGIINRVHYAGAYVSFLDVFDKIVQRTYPLVLQYMADDVFNYALQQLEIENYIQKAIGVVIYEMNQRGEVDPRFFLR